MNVLFISQCSKNALTESRRILDQFAERRGDRSWQTPITQAGLDTVYRLLRKSARRNTAVACHWIRGKDHTELLWIVGDARQFNECGATPTNTTERNVLRGQDENDWRSGQTIRLLAQLAALFHDLGKASARFQEKLRQSQPVQDPLRHEWVSLRLFEAFLGPACSCDREWLERLRRIDESTTSQVLDRVSKDGIGQAGSADPIGPFKTIGADLPVGQALAWLIASHHRLPQTRDEAKRTHALKREALCALPHDLDHSWFDSKLAPRTGATAQSGRHKSPTDPANCWNFANGLPFDSRHWRRRVKKTAESLLRILPQGATPTYLDEPYLIHLARLTLMLADHYYSSQPRNPGYGDPVSPGTPVNYANTVKVENPDRRTLNQHLDEHLIGVAVNAGRLMRSLPRLPDTLPRIARHPGFRKPSKGSFAWQNRAFDLAEGLREHAAQHGFFGVSMASTGRGKTLANARILYALAHPVRGARFTVALGLRTLTLQTGEAYRERLRLQDVDLAILAGGTATKALHNYYRKRDREGQLSGSESAASLLVGNEHVHYAGSLEEGPLKTWLQAPRRGNSAPPSSLLDAPVLVCTVDHLMPATEAQRGGHQILPMLRLLSSDLVLDEPDDFDIGDLYALSRLVHWAGMLGSRILLSSATLPPALVQGLFLAYRAGREQFQRHRGEPGLPLDIACAWFDEFGACDARAGAQPDGGDFLTAHTQFVERRIAKLAAAKEARRRAKLLPLDIPPCSAKDRARKQAHICTHLAAVLQKEALALHDVHQRSDPETGKRVSFGIIRMANIGPLFDTALALFRLGAPAGYHIHLCAYHARHPLLVRAEIERTLDAVLQEHDPDTPFRHPEVRRALAQSDAPNHLFIVLATSVAEVGRDHSYYWGIVEPSSMRSIIQLAGRIRRHGKFDCPPDTPNLLLLQTNVRALTGKPAPFSKPGFETTEFSLRSHDLGKILTPEQRDVIDAAARIRPRPERDPHNNLADLEHDRLQDLMLGAQPGATQQDMPVHHWWNTRAHLSGLLQDKKPFRYDRLGNSTFVLLPDDFELHLFDDDGQLAPKRDLLRPTGENVVGAVRSVSPWAVPNYPDALARLADGMSLEPTECALKFGTVDLPNKSMENGVAGYHEWRYHPMLGFDRK